MIEDDVYRTSSQFRLWSFTEASLKSQRATTNSVASDRVRAALRRAQEARRSANSSAAGTPAPGGGDADTRAADEKPIDCLTPEEEQQVVNYYCEQIIQLGEAYKPALSTQVRSTAIQYLRRFYLTNSPMTYHPKQIMPCVVFLATKTDNYYLSLASFADGVPGSTPEEIIAPEFIVMQSLRFTFDVRHPFRGLEGGIMELRAIASGQGRPAPHFPAQTPTDLQRALQSIAPSPSPIPTPTLDDRISRAHHDTREILKSAAQLTDAYFLYTPSQIWLAALRVADRPLAEFYLDTKLGGPINQHQNRTQKENPLYALRTKLLVTLSNCAAMLQAYQPLSSDQDQMNTLRRIIGKKLYRCQNPERANLAGQKRIPAAAAAASTSAAGGGESGTTSESEMERLAKKRKLEQEQKGRDLFGASW
ncbi:cyclin-like protein [Aspergillus heteromorphus CBS 117.55]|uniref:Cyclin-like protein n=1 Tax=Aspergillus heteromorphus CBS 117.55 TaxID=1448321 RepID=A0A317W1S4_9EURO|nr:cyclin-like protein [Aspergillus heteromorphus CBS 117.55]PWY79128.1 cyclin-like protein [Aspergillus heteromorphus CBS 117.55]